jgi:hypothetical protein
MACAGGGSDSGNPPPGAGTATTDAVSVSVSCDAIQDIESYRYVFELKQDLPDIQQQADGTPQPLSEFAEALSNLFSDMQGEGAFVAPDRSQILMRSQGEELEIRTIGDQSWIRLGATWQEQEAPGEGDLLTPASVCANQVEGLAPSLAAATGEADVVNSIETVHYRLDETDLKDLPGLLGRSGEEGLPAEFGVDVWLERNDGWPVRLETTLSYMGEGGNPVSQELFLEFRDINDPTIKIEPPPVSPAQTRAAAALTAGDG